MLQDDVIAITGAAGFIGSYLTGYLNKAGYHQLILVDDFAAESKLPNLSGKKYLQKVHREQFATWCANNAGVIKYIFHLGAHTDTTEMDYAVHKKWNLDYSKTIWEICCTQGIPLVYASSAATYGDGSLGYTDDNNIITQLQPLNPYGLSKNEFDIWAMQQTEQPPCWYGVKFFNVYGPNEYHKKRMASVIYHAYNQIRNAGTVTLFRSHNPAYKDGEQKRDFIYVADTVAICTWLMEHQPANGLYNAGTGIARTFLDLANALFHTLHIPPNIVFIDTPEDIRDKYQYYTKANMYKLRSAGYSMPFYTLEDGIKEYLTQFLVPNKNY